MQLSGQRLRAECSTKTSVRGASCALWTHLELAVGRNGVSTMLSHNRADPKRGRRKGGAQSRRQQDEARLASEIAEGFLPPEERAFKNESRHADYAASDQKAP